MGFWKSGLMLLNLHYIGEAFSCLQSLAVSIPALDNGKLDVLSLKSYITGGGGSKTGKMCGYKTKNFSLENSSNFFLRILAENFSFMSNFTIYNFYKRSVLRI